jgi:hypothetical protein
MHRRSIGETRRDLQHCFLNQYRYRIQIACHDRESKALSLERDRAAPAKRVNNGRRPVWIAAVDFGPGLCKHVTIIGVLPDHETFEDLEEALPFPLLLTGGKSRVAGWVVDKGSPDHCSGC